MQPPCKNCPDRYYKCHSACEKYIAYNNERKEIYRKRRDCAEFKDFAIAAASKLAKKSKHIEYSNRGGK